MENIKIFDQFLNDYEMTKFMEVINNMQESENEDPDAAMDVFIKAGESWLTFSYSNKLYLPDVSEG